MSRWRWVTAASALLAVVLVGSLGAAGPAGAAAQAPQASALADADLGLVSQVAAVYDPEWEYPYPIDVPSLASGFTYRNWSEVPGLPGTYATAIRVRGTHDEVMPSDLLVRVWHNHVPGDGLQIALLDGTTHQVRAAAGMASNSTLQHWSGAAAGDVLLVVDPTGTLATDRDAGMEIGAQDDAADYPTLVVDGPEVVVDEWPTQGSIFLFGDQRWFRVGGTVAPGAWVTLDLGIDNAANVAVKQIEVINGDGSYPEQDTTTAFSGADEPAQRTWRWQPGQLIMVAAQPRYYPPVWAGGPVDLVAHARLVAVSPKPTPPLYVTVSESSHDAPTPTSVTLTWWSPLWEGDGPVTSYTATASPGGAHCTTPAADNYGGSCTLTLNTYTPHTFTVTATNSFGTSAASTPTPEVTYTGPVAPAADPPAIVTATPRSRDLDVSWSAAPDPVGGWPITGYVVTVDEGSREAPATARSLLMPAVNTTTPSQHTVTVSAVTTGTDGIDVVGPGRTITVSSPGVVSADLRVIYGDKLFVDAAPNRARGHWRFDLQRLKANGTWKTLGTYRTRGTKQTRTLNLRQGRYRVRMLDRYGYLGSTSDDRYLVR